MMQNAADGCLAAASTASALGGIMQAGPGVLPVGGASDGVCPYHWPPTNAAGFASYNGGQPLTMSNATSSPEAQRPGEAAANNKQNAGTVVLPFQAPAGLKPLMDPAAGPGGGCNPGQLPSSAFTAPTNDAVNANWRPLATGADGLPAQNALPAFTFGQSKAPPAPAAAATAPITVATGDPSSAPASTGQEERQAPDGQLPSKRSKHAEGGELLCFLLT